MSEMISFPRVLKVKDIQQILQIGRVAAYRLIHTGAFPVIRVGRSYRIPEEEFLCWMRTNFGPVLYPISLSVSSLPLAGKNSAPAIDESSILGRLRTGGTIYGRN